MSNASHKHGVIKAKHDLQNRVGSGPLNEAIVNRCENVMKNNDIDFTPMAREYLDEMLKVSQAAKAGKYASKEEAVAAITAPVMQLKANAPTFGYDLIGSMATIMLSFMETIEEIDNTVVQIVEAHHQTLLAIVTKGMKGDGGEYGKILKDELQGVCKRYVSKMRSK
jgi:hypothetical protein